MRRTLTLAVLALSLGALIGGTSPSALAQPAGGKTLIMALDQSDVQDARPRAGSSSSGRRSSASTSTTRWSPTRAPRS